jgi:hypothetical protein
MARNAVVATRAVIDEAYAKGDFNGTTAEAFIFAGRNKNNTTGTFSSDSNITDFMIDNVGNITYGGSDGKFEFQKRVAALLGESNGSSIYAGDQIGYQAVHFFGENLPGTTIFNADGFLYYYTPEGKSKGKTYIIVTYKADRVPLTNNTYEEFCVSYNPLGRLIYNPDAGYEVYHLVRAN